MNFDTQRILKVGLISVAMAATLAACSKPEPALEPTNTAPVAPRPSPGVPTPTLPAGPTNRQPLPQMGSQVTPGSINDFRINAGERVYFDFDQYTLRPDAAQVLNAQATWLIRYPQVTVRIDGNADERGTSEYNFALGSRRATAVKNYLVSRGVAPSRIETVSYGKSRPIDPRSNEAGWAVNRNAGTSITGGAR